MTSRVSFPKLLLETVRRHVAAVLIVVLVFFIHIVSFFLNVQNIFNTNYVTDYTVEEALSSSIYPTDIPADDLEYMLEELIDLCSPNMVNAILAMLVGVYLAFDFLRYMHSKKETDFYASMPIKRQTLFKTIFTSSFCVFAILATVTTGIELVIAFGTGYGSLLILQNMLWNLLCMLGVFLACWVTTALAMVMTGHSIIAFLALGVFACYVPLILSNLIPTYASVFFDTYVYSELSDIVYYFSPATLGYKLMNSWYEWKFAEHWTYFIGTWGFALIIGVIAYLLFLKRPSEAAGRAMAFEKANSTIRFLLVIPLALYAGLFLREMASFASVAWLIFGVVFAAFLLHGIMEAIFQFDVRGIVGKKRQLAVTILLSLAFVAIFLFDIFKFDAYIPKAKDVRTVQLSSYLAYYDQTGLGFENDWLYGEYVEDALQAVKDVRDYEGNSDDMEYYSEGLTVTYTLKNGKQAKRQYYFNANDVPESLNQLYATEEFKDDYCILYKLDKVNLLSLRINNGLQTQSLELTEDEINEFCEIYLTEYAKTTFKEMFSSSAVFELVVDYKPGYDNSNYSESYYIYSSFTDTIAFLREKGIRYFEEIEDVKLENLHLYGGKFSDTGEEYVSDEMQLKELQKYMLPSDFMCYNYSGDEYIYGELRYKTDGEQTAYLGICIKQSDVEAILGTP